MQLLQDGDGEGGGLAGAGLCATQQVAALDQVRDGLRLDGGRVGVAFGLKGFQNGLDEPQVVERGTFHGRAQVSLCVGCVVGPGHCP
jgi:hypothetical protein